MATNPNPVSSHKRYLLLKQHAALAVGESHLAGVWRAQRESLPAGTALPTTMPFYAQLIAAGYTERECLDGATTEELARNLELAPFDALAIVTAYDALPPIEEVI